MVITIQESLVPTLERLASEQNLTVEQCVVSNIEAYLSTQKRLEVIRTVENDITVYEPIITAKKIEVEEIKKAEEIAIEEAKVIEETKVIEEEKIVTPEEKPEIPLEEITQ